MCADVVADMQLPGRAHARHHTRFLRTVHVSRFSLLDLGYKSQPTMRSETGNTSVANAPVSSRTYRMMNPYGRSLS